MFLNSRRPPAASSGISTSNCNGASPRRLPRYARIRFLKKLKAQPDHFRIRVGDYRVIYRIDGKRVVIVIVRIGHRREVYR
ncbi:MAG: type II toxin-antitoxin system RelE/ParE family toxin [Candidatus Sulfotelmatobacter sp.]